MTANPTLSCVGITLALLAVGEFLDGRWVISATLGICAVILAALRLTRHEDEH